MTDSLWFNFALEIGFLSFLGVLYYFYQKRKIVQYEENKTPIVLNFLLQAALAEKTETANPELDTLIEKIDDYLNQKTSIAPLPEIKNFASSGNCPEDFKETILEALKELE